MRDIVYIVEQEIVDNMDNIVTVSSIAGNVLTVCGTKWARIGKVVQDGSANDFTIAAVDQTLKTITVTPVGPSFTGDTLALNVPTFVVGTPLATNKEWTGLERDERTKVPFIWMVEPTPEVLNAQDNPVERASSIRIVFLDSNNIESWLTTDTHDNRLQALYNMVSEFITAIDGNNLFEPLTTKDIRNLTKFGTETAQGFDANIINANLTGIEVRLTLNINKEDDCIC